MEWWVVLLCIFGGLFLLMASGMPVAFCFMLLNVVGVYIFWGGEVGLGQLGRSIFDSVATFAILPLPLFILMGEAMFLTGMGARMLDAIDLWLGRVPGRLSLLAVAGGALLSALSGASAASAAVLGSTLVPEMESRGYKKPMSLGPIIGSGGLANMIPPSALAVILASLALISIGRLLIAIIIPGILMAILYGAYVIIRCWLQPSIAPPYQVPPISLSEKLVATVKYVLPLGVIIFLVTGLIFLGVATPTEAGAVGTLGTFILAACYRRLNWEMVKKSIGSAVRVTGMLLIIISGAFAFSQVLAFSGVTKGLLQLMVNLPVPTTVLIIGMMTVLLALGCVMDTVAMVMVTLPMYMPVIDALGLNPIWFAVLMLLSMEMAQSSPPYGVLLFVMKGVTPPDTTMGDIYRAALPFLGCDLVAMAFLITFPSLALWLPGMMH